jgi:hypothetical protein
MLAEVLEVVLEGGEVHSVDVDLLVEFKQLQELDNSQSKAGKLLLANRSIVKCLQLFD